MSGSRAGVAGILLVIAAAGLAGCDESAGVEAPAAAEVAASAAPDAAAAPDLGDAEVAHVAVTANSIDIELGEVAVERAASEEVRAFARTMIADHTAVNEQAAALAGRLGVTPAANAVSASLRAGADDARASLAGATGADFDRGYIDREVGYHQAVLDALDGLLIPTTENSELRELLVTVRPAIAAHLDHARTLQRTLAAGR